MSTPHQRHAVVTGGAQGIGLATVSKLQADGLAVHIFDLGLGPEPAYAEALAAGATLHKLDVTDLAAVDAGIAACPRIDVLVTSAGIAGPNATTWDYLPDDWRRIMAINLDGTWHALRAAAPG